MTTKVEEARDLARKLTEQFEADGTDPNLALVSMSIMVSILAAGVIRSSPRFEYPGFVENRKHEFLSLIGRTIDNALEVADDELVDPEVARDTLHEFDGHVHGKDNSLPPV